MIRWSVSTDVDTLEYQPADTRNEIIVDSGWGREPGRIVALVSGKTDQAATEGAIALRPMAMGRWRKESLIGLLSGLLAVGRLDWRARLSAGPFHCWNRFRACH
jgi:hypothetical protein